ncbi:MAG: NADH-quinone oxidoreductase subunit N [Chloroflexi bacterium]|nr:NADH-quinone oxidoreductase subunit N [Chloroflexota bacterium]|tara:strand:+ start:32287 stop:33798 length:1512 start_codon:yes stop_codon:yes gene_type:complete
MVIRDIFLLSPEISLAILAIFIIGLRISNFSSKVTTRLTLIGFVIPFVLVGLLWIEVNESQQINTLYSEGNLNFIIAGGNLSIDSLSLFFKMIFLIAGFLVILATSGDSERKKYEKPEFYPLFISSLIGMMLLPSTNDMMTMYVSLELSTLPMVILAAFSITKKSSESALKFLILSAISSAILLYGIALVFGYLGTIEFDVLALGVQEAFSISESRSDIAIIMIGMIMIIAGLGFKIALFPFHVWIPDVYEGAPIPITAFLSVASKAAGFGILLRVLNESFGALSVDWGMILAILAVASMTFGNAAAIVQSNIKRMLAYSTIAHAGYAVIGLAVALEGDIGATIYGVEVLLFFLMAYSFTNLGAFFSIMAIGGDDSMMKIDDLSGLRYRSPFIAGLMSFNLLSLTGIPPTVGFMAKLFIFFAAVKVGLTWLAVIGVVNSVVSAYYYFKVIRVIYTDVPEQPNLINVSTNLKIAMMITASGVIVGGLWPDLVLHFAEIASKNIF